MPVYTDKVPDIGKVTQPTSGIIRMTADRNGVGPGAFFTLTFTLDKARIPVTDAGASGSYGTLPLMQLEQQGVEWFGCRQNYTAFVEGTALTTGAGDAAFKIGVGTTAIASAADNALATTENDIGAAVSITNSGGTGAGTAHTAANKIVDGTTTAAKINLNWSGSAASIDANSTIDVTGTITVSGVLLGDD